MSGSVQVPPVPGVGGLDDDLVSNAAAGSASLYVKNLSPEADELFLYQRFSPFGGLLSCKIKRDPATGKCRGVGFVNFLDQQDSLCAMQQLHGSRISDGRQLHISLQAPRAVRVAVASVFSLGAGSSPSSHYSGPSMVLGICSPEPNQTHSGILAQPLMNHMPLSNSMRQPGLSGQPLAAPQAYVGQQLQTPSPAHGGQQAVGAGQGFGIKQQQPPPVTSQKYRTQNTVGSGPGYRAEQAVASDQGYGANQAVKCNQTYGRHQAVGINQGHGGQPGITSGKVGPSGINSGQGYGGNKVVASSSGGYGGLSAVGSSTGYGGGNQAMGFSQAMGASQQWGQTQAMGTSQGWHLAQG